jgi:hypothetical protein
VGVSSGLENGFAGVLDESVEGGYEGVKVVGGLLVGFLGGGGVFERFLPLFFEFRVGVVPSWGWGRDEVEASDGVEG